MKRRVRLGDVIDDYCTRCRMIMNHGIVGMVGDDVAKVRCNTCQSEHAFKHGRVPKRRRGETDRLFAEVLRGMGGKPDETEADGESAESGETPEPSAATPEEDEVAAAAPSRGARARPRGEDEKDDASEPEAAAESDAAADPAEREADPEPSHGVRRKLFTIRRHSGGKPPVAGVTTDGSAERRAAQAAAGGRQGSGQGGPGGRGHAGGGGRHGHGGGGRPDQQGRWPRRGRRR
jgi:hypothetical protein